MQVVRDTRTMPILRTVSVKPMRCEQLRVSQLIMSEPKCSPSAFQEQSTPDKYGVLAHPACEVFTVAR